MNILKSFHTIWRLVRSDVNPRSSTIVVTEAPVEPRAYEWQTWRGSQQTRREPAKREKEERARRQCLRRTEWPPTWRKSEPILSCRNSCTWQKRPDRETSCDSPRSRAGHRADILVLSPFILWPNDEVSYGLGAPAPGPLAGLTGSPHIFFHRKRIVIKFAAISVTNTASMDKSIMLLICCCVLRLASVWEEGFL